jgi:hypothetical protein
MGAHKKSTTGIRKDADGQASDSAMDTSSPGGDAAPDAVAADHAEHHPSQNPLPPSAKDEVVLDEHE